MARSSESQPLVMSEGNEVGAGLRFEYLMKPKVVTGDYEKGFLG